MDPAVEKEPLSPLRILAFDELQGFGEVVEHLQRLGCTVLCASTALEAADAVLRTPFDLVLCAIGRPPERGLEVLSALLAEDPTLDVVVVASDADFESAVESMRRGARDYIPRPVSHEALQAVVAQRRRRAASPATRPPPRRPQGLIVVPPAPVPVPGGAFTLDELEREHVTRVVAWADSLGDAARVLGVDRGTLRRKLRRWRAQPATCRAG
jgi:DNA-binding NtrC family response regulator